MQNKKYASLEDYKTNNFKDKLFLFQLTEKNSNPSMTKSDGRPMFYPPKYKFQYLVDEVYDASSGSRREIRYAQGVQTIYVDKQNPELDYTKKNFKSEFLDGLLIIEGSNKLAIDYLMNTNFNKGNPNRDRSKVSVFEFIDKQGEYKNVVANDMKEQEAATWCYNAPFEDVLAYARVKLGKVEGKDSDEIRWNMRAIAKMNPIAFMSEKDKPLTKRKHSVLNALDRNIIAVNASSNSVVWFENPNQPLTTAPIGVDAIDHFVQATFTNDGELIYSAIVDRMKPVIKNATILNTFIPEARPVEQEVSKPVLEVNAEGWKDLVDMYEAGIDKSVVKKQGAWIMYGDYKIQGKTAFIEKMKTDEKMLEKMKIDLK